MGNSGSVHHMQSSLKELHTYYQVQSNTDEVTASISADDFAFLKDEQKFPLPTSINRLRELASPSTTSKASGGVNSSHHFKVLPSLSENLRLRSTTNGAILHSGGTISGRKESVLPSQPPKLLMERSRTFIADNSEDYMNRSQQPARVMTMLQRRSQTQLDIDIRKRNPNKLFGGENVNYKQFSSNLNLRRPSPMINDDLETYSNETYQKLSKVKIKTKKRKAPPVPPSTSDIPPIIKTDHQSNELERKQRLFKTKTETTSANHLRQQPIRHSQRGNGEEFPGVVMRSKLNPPGFRREKSFDAKFFSSEMPQNSKKLQQDALTKRKSLQSSKTTTIPSLSLPIVVYKMEKSDDFNMVTAKAMDPLARQRVPSSEDQQRKLTSPPSRSNRPETQSKIPQLKKTFYFGMEGSKRKPLTTRMITNNSSRKPINLSLPLLDDTIIAPTTTSNSLSKEDHNEVYLLNHQKFENEMMHDNGIQLNVRPTLPRRQLEIPRFSPVAAWKTLSVDDELRKEQHPHSSTTTTTSTSPNPPSLNAAIETANTYLIEDRIHRTYRDPCPFYPDNKSGDSGISGDDGYIVEKPIQPQNLEHQNNFSHELVNFDNSYPVDNEQGGGDQPTIKVVGPFLTAWTPQQDLEDEEDSSSDGGGGDEMSESHTLTSPHVFSLSLPRENQLAVYGEMNKLDFRSLQKLKRTTSGDLNINGGCNQSSSDSQHNLQLFDGDDICLGKNLRNDNWVLSKTTGMAGVPSKHHKNDPKNCTDSSNLTTEGTSYFDLSVSVQPMSLGSLATGKHVMYLPNRTTATTEFNRHSAAAVTAVGPRVSNATKSDNSLEDLFCKNIPTRTKRFNFQSSVRQIERRRLAEKLSKEANQKEALRKSELEAMRRVEEEFQKKRAYEKASIRQQLRLYSMDDDNFMSLPNLNDYRAEPDGAVSSASETFPLVLRTPTTIRRKNF